MNLTDASLYYLAALTYHPEIATFGGRGAWRVHHCVQWFWPQSPRVVRVQPDEGEPEILMLHIQSPRPLKPGTYVNPTKLLREVLEQRDPFSQPVTQEIYA